MSQIKQHLRCLLSYTTFMSKRYLSRPSANTQPPIMKGADTLETSLESNSKRKLMDALNQTELAAKQRNAFEQQTLPALTILSVSEDGKACRFGIEVTQEMCHYAGGMIHAGSTASLMLDASALQATMLAPNKRLVLSVSSSFDFLEAARVGEELILNTTTFYISSNFINIEIKMYNKDARPIAIGKHLMVFRSKSDPELTPTGTSFI